MNGTVKDYLAAIQVLLSMLVSPIDQVARFNDAAVSGISPMNKSVATSLMLVFELMDKNITSQHHAITTMAEADLKRGRYASVDATLLKSSLDAMHVQYDRWKSAYDQAKKHATSFMY